jgi:hypothetical protein
MAIQTPISAAAGAMPARGPCDVVLDSSSFVTPPRCASCLAPPQTTLDATKQRSFRGWLTSTTFTQQRQLHLPIDLVG